QIVDGASADLDARRLGDEPLAATGELARLPVLPVEVAGLARGQRQAMTARVGAFGMCAAEAREYQHAIEIDARQCRHARDDVAHEGCQAIGVVDHRAAQTHGRRGPWGARVVRRIQTVATGERRDYRAAFAAVSR